MIQIQMYIFFRFSSIYSERTDVVSFLWIMDHVYYYFLYSLCESDVILFPGWDTRVGDGVWQIILEIWPNIRGSHILSHVAIWHWVYTEVISFTYDKHKAHNAPLTGPDYPMLYQIPNKFLSCRNIAVFIMCLL